jgi:hypothetical protein
VLAAVVLLTCAACGGAKRQAAAPETNPWADYKGTYAPGGAAEAPVSAAEVKSATKDDKDDKDDKPAKTADAKPRKGSKPGKTAKPSKATAEPAPAPAPAPKAAAANDATAMYDIPTEPKADAPAADTPPKKTPKKRAGRKGAKKPAP